MQNRDKYLRTKTLKRYNFTCQKCKLEDKTGKKLEAHHIIPLYARGKDEIDNIITLCFDCHRYAPNDFEEFKEYIKDEIEGIVTALIKAFKKVKAENPELIEEMEKENVR
ncbi:MAG: HNH endonuclease [Nanoarchaeota archaeon]|nr:HNH endonuclease [Nanoarchaeota archaeon]